MTACGSRAALWRPRHSTFDIIILALESTTQHYDSQRRLPPPPLPMAQYCGHSETKATNPLLAVRACLLLSLYHSKTVVSLALNQLCHIKLFSFALRVFSMKWSNRLSVFSFAPFRSSTLFLDSAARCCFCVCPSIFQKNIPPAFPEETSILRILWHLSSTLSISISFGIGCKRLLTKYILKEHSRFRSSHLLLNTSAMFLLFFS